MAIVKIKKKRITAESSEKEFSEETKTESGEKFLACGGGTYEDTCYNDICCLYTGFGVL